MNTKMTIEVEFSDNAFVATADIILDEAINILSFSFILNNDLVISEIQSNGKPVSYEKISEERPTFRPLSQKIVLHDNDTIRRIQIRYSGSVAFSPEKRSCWHNIITRDIKSLSWYSVWYPQGTSIEIQHDKVKILNGSDYFCVKGHYDEALNVWEYGDEGYDPFNIMAYRKEVLQTVYNPSMNIYFVDDTIKRHAARSVEIYNEIVNFYNGNLFNRVNIPVLDVACASPAITTGGGYRRKDFMWCTSLGNNDLEIAWLNAHETAHKWCTGANSSSWEDWLNETTAEWASLLFALSRNDMALFDFILKPKLEKSSSFPPIKTPDNSRPNGVHEKGTVLFYELYQKYGVEPVRSAVRIFTDLKIKNTAAFLDMLCNQGQNQIADFIKEGIMK